MSDPPRRMIEVGTFSGSGVFFVDPSGPDPAAVLLRDAEARLDAARKTEARALAAEAADIERVKAMQKARGARRFRQALRMFTRMSWR